VCRHAGAGDTAYGGDAPPLEDSFQHAFAWKMALVPARIWLRLSDLFQNLALTVLFVALTVLCVALTVLSGVQVQATRHMAVTRLPSKTASASVDQSPGVVTPL